MPVSDEFWAAIRRSADLVRGLPAWTQAGIVLSDNFDGGVKSVPCCHCGGTGKAYRWKGGDV
jgi:hypothetical protein